MCVLTDSLRRNGMHASAHRYRYTLHASFLIFFSSMTRVLPPGRQIDTDTSATGPAMAPVLVESPGNQK